MTAQARLVVELAVGAVFLLACLSKLPHPRRFALGVADYEVLPRPLALVLGFLLIPLEGFVAVAHLTGWQIGLAVPLGIALLSAFAVAISVNLLRGRGLPCHCLGGGGAETLSARSLARLGLLLAGELFLVLVPEPRARPALADLGLAAVWATAVLLTGYWLLSADEILALRKAACKTCGPAPPVLNAGAGSGGA